MAAIIDMKSQICVAIGFGISLDFPTRNTPIANSITEMSQANGNIHAPKRRESGANKRISSAGEMIPIPSIMQIVPIVARSICSPLRRIHEVVK